MRREKNRASSCFDQDSKEKNNLCYTASRAVIVKVLSNNGHVLLRIAGERGWVTAENSEGDPVFTEVKGTLTKDT